MCVEDRPHVPQTVAGDRCNLRFGAPRQSQARYGRSTQIIECDTRNSGLGACLTPARAEAVGCPGFAVSRCQDNRAALCSRIQRSLERCANRNNHSATRFGLLKPDMGSVKGRPRQSQQISLSLSRPQCEQPRQMQMGWRRFEECRLVICGPNLFSARPAINPPSPLAWVYRNSATIF